MAIQKQGSPTKISMVKQAVDDSNISLIKESIKKEIKESKKVKKPACSSK